MGWLKTADDYFTGFHPEQVNVGVQYIIDSVVEALKRNPERKFSYAEVGFMTRWLEDRSQAEIQDLISLVNNGCFDSPPISLITNFRTTGIGRWWVGATR